MGGDVLHVAHIFVAAFNLEGAHARINQRAKVGGLIVVFHRQQVFFKGDHASLIIFQGIRQSTGLRAIAAVGATPGLGMRDVTLAGISHAQRTVDKELDGGVGGLVNRSDLLKIQFARQHDLTKSDVGEKFSLFYAADITLRTGVELNGGNIQLQNSHILHDQRINARVIQVGNQLLRRFQLIIMQNGIQRNKNFGAKAMGKRHQFGDILQAIAGVMACAKTGAANINGISAVQNGFAGNCRIACRAKKFKMSVLLAHTVGVIQ